MNKLKEANANSRPAQRWMFEVWEQPLSKVGNATKVVAGVIASCAWGGKDTAHPSYKSIAQATGQSSKTISKAVKQLQEAGLLVVDKKVGSQGKYNVYRLTFPMGTDDLAFHTETETLLSIQGEVALPMETPRFPYEDDSLYTGKAEALIEAPKEALKESLTMLLTQPVTTYNNDLGFLDEELPNIEPLLPLDALARVEPSVIENLFAEIQHSTDHIDRALQRKDYANAKKRAWGVV